MGTFTTDLLTGQQYLFDGNFTSSGGTGGTSYSFAGSGATVVNQSGGNVIIYSPTGSSSNTFIASGGTIISQVGDVVTIYSITGSSGGGSITGGTNGLGVSGADITLGGTLTGNTTIILDDKILSFNNDYQVFGDGISGGFVSAYTIELLSDAKQLIGGGFTTYNGTVINPNLVKLNVDGSLDTGFTTSDIFNGEVFITKEYSGNTILVGGFFTNYDTTYNGIVRLNSNGSTDTTFSGSTSGLDNGLVKTIAVQADGKILLGAAGMTGYNFSPCLQNIIRLNSDGSADPTFSGATVGFDFDVESIKIQTDDKILVSGWFTTYDGITAERIIRLNSNGSIDSGFTSVGVPGGGFNQFIQEIALQVDGKVLVVGEFNTYSGITANRIARLNTNGTIDTGFTMGSGFNATPYQIFLQSDGKMLVVGQYDSYSGITTYFLTRLNSDGSIDPTFTSGFPIFSNGYIALDDSTNDIFYTGQLGTFPPTYSGVTVGNVIKLYSGGTLNYTYNTYIQTYNININSNTITTPNINASAVTTNCFRLTNNAGSGRILISSASGVGSWGCLTHPVWSTFSQGSTVGGCGTVGVGACTQYCRNTILGTQAAGSSNICSKCNTAIGYQALRCGGCGCGNVALGYMAGHWESGCNKLHIGNNANFDLISGDFATGIVTLSCLQFCATPDNGQSCDSVLVLDADDGCVKKLPYPSAPSINGYNGLTWDGNNMCLGGILATNPTQIALANNELKLTNEQYLFLSTNAFLNKVNAIALQGDGKIVVGGEFTDYSGVTANRIIRLNSDGTIDAGFTSGAGFNNNVFAVAIQGDGKILAGGQFTSYSGNTTNRIARLNSDGTLDTAFTASGGTGFNNIVYSIAINNGDGKIYAGGKFGVYNGNISQRIVRLNSDGSIDNTYGSIGGGFLGGSFGQAVRKVLIDQGTGSVYVGGEFNYYFGSIGSAIARLDSGGIYDATFAVGGGLTGGIGTVYDIIFDLNGKLIVGGWFDTYDTTGATYGILKLNQNGSIDTGFTANSGFNVGAGEYPLTLAEQTNGQILVGGTFNTYDGNYSPYSVRIFSGGVYDGTLSGYQFDNVVRSIVIQSDTKILMGGDFVQYNTPTTSYGAGYIGRIRQDGNYDASISEIKFNGDTITTPDLITSGFTFQDGSQQAGYVLTSDANGVATWQASSGGTGTITGGTNGLSVSGANIALGGVLIRNTNIGGAYTLALTGTTTRISTWSGYQISGFTVMSIPGALTSGNFKAGQSALNSITTGACNTGIGAYALNLASTGHFNTAVGGCALRCSTTGCNNTAVGWSSMCKNTGKDNVSMGASSLRLSTTASCNTVIGVEGILSNTIGSGNTAMGYKVLSSNVTGNTNVAIGRCAGFSETGSNKLHIANCNLCSLIYGEFDTKMVKIDGSLCVTALPAKSTETCGLYIDGSGKLSVGIISGGTGGSYTFIQSGATVISQVGNNITVYSPTFSADVTGATNLGSGNGTLFTSVSDNKINLKTLSGGTNVTLTCNGNYVAINASSGTAATVTGATNGLGLTDKNVCLGGALLNNTSIIGNYTLTLSGGSKLNTTCGYQISGQTMFYSPSGATGLRSVFIGCAVGQYNATGNWNVGIGDRALQSLTNGDRNIAIGYLALNKTTTGDDNIAMGYNSLQCNVSNGDNIALGNCAMGVANGGSSNIAIGSLALCQNTGGANIGIGYTALRANLAGQFNVSVGYAALGKNQGGSDNIVMGFNALCSNVSGNNNIAIGTSASQCSTSSNNVVIGREAAYKTTSGANNVVIGYSALGCNQTGGGSVAIGYTAGQCETSSNRLHIANAACTGSTSFIYGEFDNKRLKTNATFEVSSCCASGCCNFIYLGDKDADDSWRMYVSGGTNLVFERKITGSWTCKGSFAGV